MKTKLRFGAAIAIAFFLIISLTACGTKGNDQKEGAGSNTPAQTEQSGQTDSTNQSDDPLANLPQKKTITVEKEGMKEEHEAILAISKQGYGVYILPMFQFKAEESGKDRIYFENDDRYYEEIEILSSDFNLDELKQAAEKELKDALGQVEEIKGDQIYDPFFQQTEFYFIGSNADQLLSQQIYLKKIEDHYILVHVYMPMGEASEGVGPSLREMIKSIVLK